MYRAFRQCCTTAFASLLLLSINSTPVLGMSAKAAKFQTAVGALKASFGVNANGEAVYKIPIDIPPGIRDVHPRLSLAYGSHKGNGKTGVGWTLRGLSTIARCPAIEAIDGFRGTVSYQSTDRFCLNGQRLILVKGEYGGPGSMYHTEIESWRSIQASRERCGKGPCSFTVTDKNGVTHQYGEAGNSHSRVLAKGRPDVRVWARASSTDRNGNRIDYKYTLSPTTAGKGESDAQYYILRIEYTANGDVEPNRSVRFRYEPRDDVQTTYLGGSAFVTRARLTNIQTYLADLIATDYRLHYRYGEATHRSRLKELQRCSGSEETSTCLDPPTRLDYQDTAKVTFAAANMDAGLPTNPVSVFPMDIQGDGRGDLIYITSVPGTLNVDAYISSGTSTALEYSQCPNTLQLGSSSRDELLPLDLDADGRTDLVHFYGNQGSLDFTAYIARPDSCGFGDASTVQGSLDQSSEYSHLWPMDVNGDGHTDMVGAWPASGSPEQRILVIYLGSAKGLKQVGSSGPITVFDHARFWPMDVNGDGMVDLVQAGANADGALTLISYVSDGKSFGKGLTTNTTSGLPNAAYLWPIDVNGDHKADIVQAWQSEGALMLTTFLADGSGRFVPGTTTDTGRGVSNLAAFWPMDPTGSGRLALVQAWGQNGALALYVYRSNGIGFDKGTPAEATLSATEIDRTYPVDINGDGKTDLLQAWQSSNAGMKLSGFISQGPIPDLAKSFTDGLGGAVDVSYLPMSDPKVYTPATETLPAGTAPGLGYAFRQSPAVAPYQILGGSALPLVSQYQLRNAPETNQSSYSYTYPHRYAGARRSLEGRGWLGFQKVTQVDRQRGTQLVSTYHQQFPLTGMRASRSRQCASSELSDPKCTAEALLRHTTYSYWPSTTLKTQPEKGVFQVLTQAKQEDLYTYGKYDFGLRTEYGYDNFGNLTRKAHLGKVDKQGRNLSKNDDVYTYQSFSNDLTHWRIGFLLAHKVTASSTDAEIATWTPQYDLALSRVAAYDSPLTMNVQKRQQWDDENSVWLTSTFGYDRFGNRRSEIGPAGNASTTPSDYAFTTRYETTYHTYPETRTTPQDDSGISLSTSYDYDPHFGLLTSIIRPNGGSFTKVFDPFGRLSEVQHRNPSGTLTPIQKRSWRVKDRQIWVETEQLIDWSAEDWRATDSYLDGLHRAYRTTAQGSTPDQSIVSSRSYVSRTLVDRQSLPHFDNEPPQFLTTHYDAYGRKIEMVAPIESSTGPANLTTRWRYPDRAQVIRIEGVGEPDAFTRNRTIDYFNGNRRTTQMVVPADDDATTTYAYDRLGRLRGVTDPVGARTSITYDSLGRKLTLSEASIGTLSFHYDVRGQLDRQTDSLEQTIAYTYDRLGRKKVKSTPDRTITLSYDVPVQSSFKHTLGKLSSVEIAPKQGNSVRYAYGYDLNGRESQRSLFHDGKEYSTVLAYLPQGDIGTYRYPDGSALAHHYNPQGFLHHITLQEQDGATATYATFGNYDARGAARSIVYGGGANTETRELDWWGQMTGYQLSSNGGSEPVLDLVYKRDPFGNLLRIVDKNAPSADADQSDDYSQVFTYKNQRLKTASAGSYGELEFDYDLGGNITRKDGFTYNYANHQLIGGTDGNGRSFTLGPYPNGNLAAKSVTDVGQETEWAFAYDAENHLTEVTRTGTHPETLRFTYDHRGRRLTKQSANATTLFASPSFWVSQGKEGVSYTRFLFSPSERFASIVTPGDPLDAQNSKGAPVLTYLHKNQVNSVSVRTNTDGSVKERVLYKPYGEIHQRRSPDGLQLEFGSKPFDRASELYYFGARYYDPGIGRFTTADRGLGGGRFTQDSYSRYAYVLGNPTNFTDPTGRVAGPVCLLGVGPLVTAPIGLSARFGVHANGYEVLALTTGTYIGASTLCMGAFLTDSQTVSTVTSVLANVTKITVNAWKIAGYAKKSYAWVKSKFGSTDEETSEESTEGILEESIEESLENSTEYGVDLTEVFSNWDNSDEGTSASVCSSPCIWERSEQEEALDEEEWPETGYGAAENADAPEAFASVISEGASGAAEGAAVPAGGAGEAAVGATVGTEAGADAAAAGAETGAAGAEVGADIAVDALLLLLL